MSRRKLLILGLDESITREQVEIHFQSRKKSGGSDVRSVDFDKLRPGEAIVEFENEEGTEKLTRSLQCNDYYCACRIPWVRRRKYRNVYRYLSLLMSFAVTKNTRASLSI